jgi:hypothetical protein
MCVYTAVVNVDQHGIVFIWKPKVDMVQNFVSSLLPSYQINTKPYSIMPTYKAFNFFFQDRGARLSKDTPKPEFEALKADYLKYKRF